jgi:FKBP-type peptidyl-prolyl cis-trans isomerase 2
MKRAFMGAAPLLLLLLAVIGCAPATVADKKFIQVNYKGTLTDGSVFDQNEAGKPLEFLVGGHTMMPAFEKALMGLKVGDKKTFTVPAAATPTESTTRARFRTFPRTSFPRT